MATNFPTSLDNFTNPASGNTLDSPSHSLQHSDANDAIEAIETKLGIGNSPAGSATSGYVLMAGTGGTTTWSALPASGGLIQVVPTSVAVGSGSGSVDANGAVSFTTSSSVSINGCFTSTYDNYLSIIYISAVSAGDQGLAFRLRTTSDDSSNLYYYAISRQDPASYNFNVYGGNPDTKFGLSDATARTVTDLFIGNPNVAAVTQMRFGADGSGYRNVNGGGYLNTTTQYTGFTVYPSANNITGVIRIYGFRK